MAEDTPPLYGSTYTLHRVSPLHATAVADLLSKTALEEHSRRFADLLRGNVLRGVHVGLAEHEGGLPRGSLKQCQWTFLRHDAAINEEPNDEEQASTGPDGFGLTEGVQVKLDYERATYLALLLRSPLMNTQAHTGEWHFPLLLSRMPTDLRTVLLEYVADAFDARAEPLYLDDKAIGRALEGFIDEASKTDHGLQDAIRDVQISIGFGGQSYPSLKRVDVTLQRADLSVFREQGRKTPVHGHDDRRGPFVRGLDLYLKNHMALERSELDAHFARVACGTFALGTEGRVKIFAPSFADDADLTPHEASVRKGVLRLIDILLKAAEGEES